MTEHARTEPVRLHVEMPTSRDSWTALGRPVLVLPHALLVGGPFIGFGAGTYRFGALGLAAATIAAFDWLSILFTGHPVAGLQALKRLYLRWRAHALAYACFLRDEYPPFGEGDYTASLELPETAADRSLPSVALRPLLVLPHLLLLLVLLVAQVAVWMVSWFSLVFTRRMSPALWRFSRDVITYALRVEAYALLIHDQFPAFSLASPAEPAGAIA
jgi:hypothetical protein